MKVIVAGSRTIDDFEKVDNTIHDSEFQITEVVSGGARGVDKTGEHWAVLHEIPYIVFPADWNLHGKCAGYVRNVQMGNYADALVAVWDGESRGTKHMIDYMVKLGKPIWIRTGL